LQKKALIHFESNNFNNAFYYFNKSKIASEIVKDSANIAFNLIQMATVQQVNGDYYGSKETLTEALPYIKNSNNYLTAAHNLFGIADKELSIYDDAVFYYKEAIKNAKDIVAKQSPLQNIAVVYIQQKKYNKAIEILESILHKKTLDKIEFVKNKARVLDNLGYAYFKNGLTEKGLFLMKESLKLRNQDDDSYGSIESNLHLAEYHAKSDLKKSNQYALMAYQIATKFNSIDERLKALSFLISNDSNTKNNHYAQKYIFLNDSIIKIRNNFKNKFAKIKYDAKKEKEENQQLRLEKAENLLYLQEIKYQKILFVLGIIFLVSLIVYLRKYYRNKNRIGKIKASYDTEMRIAKKIHDELANDVFQIITFAETQSLTKENIKETLLQKLDQIYIRVRGISRENNDIDVGVNYSINVKEMLATYSNKERNVIINNIEKINWETIDEIKKVAIYRVLQELMVNMKKHSYATLVVVKLDHNQKSIFMEYVDNGKGCSKNKIIKNGLQNMENRILTIKGTIIFDTEPDKGFKVKITLPK
jgi:signal transduction histidine kinase